MVLLEIPAVDGIVDRHEILCRFCRFLLGPGTVLVLNLAVALIVVA